MYGAETSFDPLAGEETIYYCVTSIQRYSFKKSKVFPAKKPNWNKLIAVALKEVDD